MTLPHTPKLPKIGILTPSARARLERAAEAEVERMQRRFLIARTAALTPGSLSKKVDAIKTAIEQKLIPAGDVPCRETVRYLWQRYENGATSAQDYAETKKRGRIPTRMALRLLKIVRKQALISEPPAISQLYADVKRTAEDEGFEVPSRHVVLRTYLRCAGNRLHRTASAFGRRAAVMDAGRHGVIVADYTHEEWCLDECTMPMHVRLWDWINKKWMSAQVDILLIYDSRSRVIVGYHICDPSRRQTKTGDVARSGFDHLDILAAILGAALPELAHPATIRFAGYLPERIRLDNAKPHRTAADLCNERNLGVKWHFVEHKRPDENGQAESGIRTFKNFLRYHLRGVIGHASEYEPTDFIKNDPAAAREKAAGTPFRKSRTLTIAPEDLLEIADLEELVEAVIRDYNERHRHSALKCDQPANAYRHYMRRASQAPRKGRDALVILDTHTAVVSKGRISYDHDYDSYEFATTAGGWAAEPDHVVTYWRDPLHRGAFAKVHGEIVFLPLLATWAREKGGEAINKERRAEAKAVSEQAQKRARDRRDEAIGKAAAEAADAAMPQSIAENKDRARRRRHERVNAGPGARAERRRRRERAHEEPTTPTPPPTVDSAPPPTSVPAAEDSRPAASPEKNDAPPAISFTVGNLRHTVRPRQEAAGPNGQSSHPLSDIEGAQSAPIAAALRDGTPPAVTITLDVNVARDPAASTSLLDSQSPKE